MYLISTMFKSAYRNVCMIHFVHTCLSIFPLSTDFQRNLLLSNLSPSFVAPEILKISLLIFKKRETEESCVLV